MKLNFVKNIQFTKLLKVNGRLKEFNFRKPNHTPESHFTVDVIDDRGDRIIFAMKNSDNRWVFVDQNLPAWIVEKEEQINEMISQEL